jgi:hypothetical protein
VLGSTATSSGNAGLLAEKLQLPREGGPDGSLFQRLIWRASSSAVIYLPQNTPSSSIFFGVSSGRNPLSSRPARRWAIPRCGNRAPHAAFDCWRGNGINLSMVIESAARE